MGYLRTYFLWLILTVHYIIWDNNQICIIIIIITESVDKKKRILNTFPKEATHIYWLNLKQVEHPHWVMQCYLCRWGRLCTVTAWVSSCKKPSSRHIHEGSSVHMAVQKKEARRLNRWSKRTNCLNSWNKKINKCLKWKTKTFTRSKLFHLDVWPWLHHQVWWAASRLPRSLFTFRRGRHRGLGEERLESWAPSFKGWLREEEEEKEERRIIVCPTQQANL